MNFIRILFGISLLMLIHCSCQEKHISNCELLYYHYQEHIMINRYDSADFYLSEAISCDASNLQYALELFSLKKKKNEYHEALRVLKKVRELSPNMELEGTQELLKLQINGVLDEEKLQNLYFKYQQMVLEKNVSEEDFVYYIALKNFFEGKEVSIKAIGTYKDTKKDFDKGLLITVEGWIANQDSLHVLRKVFNAH
jgi:tetratricopeptide (TPR) repeat protein